MTLPNLTLEQRTAATSGLSRVFIVAVPGSGKTTVAAERYGILRYTYTSPSRRILGLSFTRAATWELNRRIRQRWGPAAVRWPYKVATLDGLYAEVVHYLLRTRVLRWPGDKRELTILDTWRGQVGSRYLLPGQAYRRVATVIGNEVTSKSTRIFAASYGIGRKDHFEQHLNSGTCTHEEIRDVLSAVVRRDDLREAVAQYLRKSIRAVIVDEVFDANGLDVDFLLLAGHADINMTLIGDPWQALYEFRGAQPDLVPQLVEDQGYTEFPITRSFRFLTPSMRDLAQALRAGRGVTIPHGSVTDVDVVLASRWETLWERGDRVLPLSFGKIDNQTDAAIIILLDQLTQAYLGKEAIFSSEAATLLGLDPEIMRRRAPATLRRSLQLLKNGTTTGLANAIAELRESLRELGSPKQLRRLPQEREKVQLERLERLAKRMDQPTTVAGMTVHQAKGQEWARVGVALTPTQLQRLERGLSVDNPEDRVLYVALTRARSAVYLT